MMQNLSYKDGIFFNKLCQYLIQKIDGNQDLGNTLEKLKKYINNIEKKANGYWKLPAGRKTLIDALDAIVLLLSQKVNGMDIKAINYEYTSILSNVSDKCRVVFLAQEYSVWASLKSIYEVMSLDSRFEVKVVYVPFHHPNATYEDNNIELYKCDGVEIINHKEYSFTEDNPDIVFFAKPYNLIPLQFYITEVEKIIDETVYVPYGMESTFKLLRYGFQEYLHYRVWRHIVHGDYVKVVGKKFGYRNGENIVVWGHPKMDYYLANSKSLLPNGWKEKINGRRTVCWCPHHTIVEGPERLSTWMEFSNVIFEWFEKHTDMVLLLRPHPLLFGAIVNNGHLSKNELESFLVEIRSKENIIFDDYDDYHSAFECSDAMITDGTTFSVEYLGTGKPLMLTTDDITSYYNHNEAEKGLYIGDSQEAVIGFLENIRNGCDPKMGERDVYAKKTIFYPKDKTISEYIVDNLIDDLVYAQECLARSICE